MSARAQARLIAQFGVFLLVTLLSVFLPAGRLGWANGWVFVAIISASVASVSFGIFASSPELVRERKTAAKLAKRWDRVLVPLMSGLPLVSVVLAGLDKRFGWSHVPAVIVIAGNVLVAVGWLGIYRVFRENSFTSATIELAPDQRVVSTGPYAIVRHPMYSAALVMLLGAPVALGSWWGLVALAVISPALVWRMFDEEKFLAANLTGYAEYKQKVRYRLIPHLW